MTAAMAAASASLRRPRFKNSTSGAEAALGDAGTYTWGHFVSPCLVCLDDLHLQGCPSAAEPPDGSCSTDKGRASGESL